MTIQTTGTVTFTRDSCVASRQTWFNGLISAVVVGGIQLVLISLTFVPSIRSAVLVPSAISLIFIPIVILGLESIIPWSLTLDFDNKTYRSEYGYPPFVQRKAGGFENISYVGIQRELRKSIVVVGLPRFFGKRTYWLASFASAEEASAEVDRILNALHVSASKVRVKRLPPITTASLFHLSGDHSYLFSSSTTAFARAKVFSLNLFFFLIVFIFSITLSLEVVFKGPSRREEINTFVGLDIYMIVLFLLADVIPKYLKYKPWTMTLNFTNREYRIDEGFSKRIRQLKGSFDDFDGVFTTEVRACRNEKPYIVSLSIKNGKKTKLYPFYEGNTRAEADHASNIMCQAAGLSKSDHWGNVIRPVEDRFSSAPRLTYTKSSIRHLLNLRKLTIEGVVKLILPLLFVPILFWHPIPGYPVGVVIFVSLIIIMWSFALVSFVEAAPWTLVLDFDSRQYEIADGYSAIAWHEKGQFVHLVGVTSMTSGFYHFDPFTVAICVKRSLGKKYYPIEAAQSGAEAKRRVLELSARLGIPVLESP